MHGGLEKTTLQLGMIQYHETLYSSRVTVALFLPAVLTMCSEALMKMKLVIFWDAHSRLELPFLLHKPANIALQGAMLRLHHYHCLNRW